MNYTALQARTTVLVSFGGWSNVSPAPDYGDLVNRAYRELAWRTEFYHTSATFTTVANQSSYTLSGTDVINVYDAIYGGNYALTLSNSTYQRKSYALWTVRAAGAPSYYWMENPQNIRLYPTPPTTGTTVTLYLTRLPSDLSSGSDIPAIPQVYHEAICYRAAVLHGELYATGEEMNRVHEYLAKAQALEADMMDWLATNNRPNERQVMAVRPRRLNT